MSRLAIMQPYFIPYIGYFQLISSVDNFVFADNYKYSKQSWINRNRLLLNGEPEYLSVELKKSSDFSKISERLISPNFDYPHLLRKFTNSYSKRPYFQVAHEILKEIFHNKSNSLAEFNTFGIKLICEYLKINPKFEYTSKIGIDTNLDMNEKIYQTCKLFNATEYLNLPGGIKIYNNAAFKANNLNLEFIRPNFRKYSQGSMQFYESLSIIDLVANVERDEIIDFHLPNFELIMQ